MPAQLCLLVILILWYYLLGFSLNVYWKRSPIHQALQWDHSFSFVCGVSCYRSRDNLHVSTLRGVLDVDTEKWAICLCPDLYVSVNWKYVTKSCYIWLWEILSTTAEKKLIMVKCYYKLFDEGESGSSQIPQNLISDSASRHQIWDGFAESGLNTTRPH